MANGVVMSEANHAHQFKIFNPQLARPVTIIGAGSVGGWVALFLAKMGVTDIRVWDEDSVTSHNVPMSVYRPQDVGKYKVAALAERIKEDCGIDITTHQKMYAGEPLRNTTVIACVDVMGEGGRLTIWNAIKNKIVVDLFVDTRLDAAYIDILSIVPSNREEAKKYEALHFSDEEANIQMCGMHGIVFATTRAAGIVVATVASFWTDRTKVWRVTERCDTLERVH